ncbi:unnamed protein product [Phaedon cochleariae]|uniref:Carboxylic ester hydrolase n=1 Tax=Phaedon cochleariae TaxID=80249 RepID=A0A9P0DAB8_PHACE|nr:unnamed protein product [Phaedon cochleariae]
MEFPIVKIKSGKLRGCKKTNLDGTEFYSFLGIPYAKPPIGKLRFKAPQPVEPWTVVKDATRDGNSCYQWNLNNIEGSEDCLNLNVFTKQVTQEETALNPVMVWIHGGGFTSGSNSSETFGPEFLLTKDVVLVVINYRLGFLGFLCLQDTSLEVPGNAGLKDQVSALKWVQDNIRCFGGDPDNVTIFGSSAGGISVHYHLLSEASRGLFHKAIMQSGTALNPWGLRERHGLRFGKFIDSGVGDERDALIVLQGLSSGELFEKQEKYIQKTNADIGPIIEKPNEAAFITELPRTLIKSGKYNKVPIMLGYCSNEGLLFEIKSRSEGKSYTDEKLDLNDFIPPDLNFKQNDSRIQIIRKKLSNFYFEGNHAKNKYMLYSDYYLNIGIFSTAKSHVKTSQHPVYLYRMSFDGGLNYLKKLHNIDNFPGYACHSDDVGYLFKMKGIPNMYMGEDKKKTVRRFVQLWMNFAKYGDPTPSANSLKIDWMPIDGQTINYLDIGREIRTSVNPEADRLDLWREIYCMNEFTCDYL